MNTLPTSAVDAAKSASRRSEDVDLSRWQWRVILGSLKGGVGKSTSAWLLAWALSRRTGEKVLLTDADPKSQTTSDSYRVAQAKGVKLPFHLLYWPTHEGMVQGVREEMRKVGARHLIIDTGGEGGDGEKILEQACLLGDELIVPTAPNPPDLRRIEATLQVAVRVSSLNNVNASILLTSCKTSANDEPAARAWLTDPRRDLPVFAVFAPDTVQYIRALYNEPPSVGIYDEVLNELAALRAEEEGERT